MKILLENAESSTRDLILEAYNRITDNEDLTLEELPDNLSRWEQMVLASQGVRLYSDHDRSSSPLYVGTLPTNEMEAELAVHDLMYAKSRAEHFKSYGLTYIGRVDTDPRSVLLIDQKKKVEDRIDRVESEEVYNFLSSLPEDWWKTIGIISTTNADKLEKFLEDLIDMVPITYTTKGMAKLKFTGIDYGTITPPRNDPEYGIEVRERVNRLLNEPISSKL